MQVEVRQARLEFRDLSFEKLEGGTRINFLKTFYFDVENETLERIGQFETEGKSITFEGSTDNAARARFNQILDHGFANMYNKVTKKPSYYIHRYSGIPLIGSNAFGLIDRNTNIIEVKPLTGCNENCNYCSVDEGLRTRKVSEVVIEREYLVQEFRKLAEFKGCEVEAYINSQGEPTLYGPLPELISDLKGLEMVRGVVMNSNGSLLDEDYIDRLAAAGLKRLNLSLNAIDIQKAKIISGWGKYDIERIKRMAAYAAGKTELLIAPVWLPGYNDDEIPKLVEFALGIGAKIGIQNFLYYKRGRNPVTPMKWEDFYARLAGLEKKYGINLTKMDLADEFRIRPTVNLPKPFRKGRVVDAEIKIPGRYPNEKIAVAGNRNITISNCPRSSGNVRAKIIRSKHNVFDAIAI